MRNGKKFGALIAVALAGSLVMAVAQSYAHYRDPTTQRRLRHDLRHLEPFLADNLLKDNFIGGVGTHFSDTDEQIMDGTQLLVSIPNYARIELRRDVGGAGPDCYINFKNESGDPLFRNGVLANGATLIAVPGNADPEFPNNSSFDAALSNNPGRGSYGSYQISSPTNLGLFSFTVSVTYTTDTFCSGSVEGILVR